MYPYLVCKVLLRNDNTAADLEHGLFNVGCNSGLLYLVYYNTISWQFVGLVIWHFVYHMQQFT